MTMVTMTSKVEAENYNQPLEMYALLAWLKDIESRVAGKAHVMDPIMGDNGSQRDPNPYLRGMKMTWSEPA